MISIILPTYNGERTIGKAIESVLMQSERDWELLIVDDASTDGTMGIAQRYTRLDPRITVIRSESNAGIQHALSCGVLAARGDYVARIDDDDYWIDTEKLARQLAYMCKNPSCVLLGTDAIVVDEQGRKISENIMPKTDNCIRARILSKNCFLHATVMIRARALSEAGGYSQAKYHRHVEDYELWLRLGLIGVWDNLPGATTALMARPGSLTSSNRTLQARRMIRLAWRYRTSYPNILRGIVVSLARYIGFATISIVPIPKKLFYHIQRTYRSL